MSEKFYISIDGNCPDKFNGRKIVRGKNVDSSIIQRFFIQELFGVESLIIDFYTKNANDIKYGSYDVDVSKLSFIQRMLFFQKKKNKLSKIESREKDIKNTVQLIKKHSTIITNLCSKYNLNIDGSFKRGSKLETIYYKLSFINDYNTKKLFESKLGEIINEINSSYHFICDNILKIGAHEVYYEQGSIIGIFAFDKLLEPTNENNALLDKLLNKKINEMTVITDSIMAFNDSDTFIENELIDVRKKISVFEEIEYLKNSGHLKDADINLLMLVENSYDLVASSQLKIKFIEDILHMLGNDSKFLNLINSLRELKEVENENLQKLSIKAKEEYDKYDVRGSVELIKKVHEIDVTQGDLLFDIEIAKKDNNYDKKNISEEKLRKSGFEKKELVKRTIMAQYLRERAFKTENGNLSFREFALINAHLYNLQTEDIENLIIEEGKNNVRKL